MYLKYLIDIIIFITTYVDPNFSNILVKIKENYKKKF